MAERHKQRVVVKLGTQVVIEQSEGSVDRTALKAIVSDTAALMKSGTEVVLVSSGAVGFGRQLLGLSGKLAIEEKQACAAAGQARLMDLYTELFSSSGVKVAQILLTAADFSDRNRYLNLSNAFECLLRLGALPIVNENDVVSVAGIIDQGRQKSFDDNDKLSALVAGKLNAENLVILTNVDGVFTGNPAKNPDAELISEVRSLGELTKIEASGQSSLGRGGMEAKLQAAKVAMLCGVRTVISGARGATPVSDALSGGRGTTVYPLASMTDRKRWIALSSGYAGVVTVDDKAKEKLITERRSLLPVGVTAVSGSFDVGAVVSIQDSSGREVGRGITSQRSSSLRKLRGQRSQQTKERLGPDEKAFVIHRDNLVLFESTYAS